MSASDERWYALRTRSRFEKIVHAQLAHRDIESFLPLTRRVSQWKDRKKVIAWPLFPGYCFARFTPEQQRTAVQAPGVIQIVGSSSLPEPIPEMEIAALQRVVENQSDCRPWPYHIQKGTIMTVIRGPLRGLEGRFIRQGPSGHLVLSVPLIQQAIAVTVATQDVHEHEPLFIQN